MSAQTFLTSDQVFELNERFGWFSHGDSQSDVSKEFAQAAIEKYELMRAAAPDLLAALERIVIAIEGLGHAEGGLSGLDHLCDMTGPAYAAIAKATGKPLC